MWSGQGSRGMLLLPGRALGAAERSPIAPAGLRLVLCPVCSWGAVLSPSPPSSLCRDIRLIEVTENICKRLLDYNLHKERSGSNRFAKVRGVLQSPAPRTTRMLNRGSSFPSPVSAQHVRPCCPPTQVWSSVLGEWVGPHFHLHGER